MTTQVQRRLVFVEANGSYGREMVRKAVERELAPVVLAAEPERFAELHTAGAEVIECDTCSVSAVVRAVQQLPGSERCGMLAGYEMVLPTAAAAAKALGLPGPDPHAAHDTLHKHRARALTNEFVGNPVGFWLLDQPDDVAQIDPAEYPLIAKPAASGGSLGVRLVGSPRALREHVSAWKDSPDERGVRLTGPVLVERIVSGEELSVELFNGVPVAWSAKNTGGETGFVENGHTVSPWSWAPLAVPLKPYLERLVERLGIGWGPAHVEIRFDERRGPRLIEANYRLGGDQIPLLAQLATGFDMYTATLRHALGDRVSPVVEERGAAAIRYLMTSESGVLRKIEGVEAARARPGVRNVTITAAEGAPVRPPLDSGDRLGYVIAEGGDAAEAVQSAERAVADLRTFVEPLEGLG